MAGERDVTGKQLLLPDEPISSSEQDLLRRKTFAEHLSRQILAYDNPSSFVMAIYGPWGAGKSSLLNLVAECLVAIPDKDKVPIIVRFNPWNFSSIDQLITMFFEELRRALVGKDKRETVQKIGVALETIGLILSPGSLSPVGGQYIEKGSGFLKWLGNKINPESHKRTPLDTVKEELNQLLKKYGRRVIVFVDDIDRLETENMKLIFRLIRLNGDFSYTSYVLALDRGNTEKI